MYLPNSRLASGPFSPANEISGCTTRQYSKKAMERGKKESLTTRMQCRHIQTHFMYLLRVMISHSSSILPSEPIRPGKPHMRRIKGSLSYLPSPSSILPSEAFHVNNRCFPNQSLSLVHWLKDKRATLLLGSLWRIKYIRFFTCSGAG